MLIKELKGVLLGARCKLEEKQGAMFMWKSVRENGGANDP